VTDLTDAIEVIEDTAEIYVSSNDFKFLLDLLHSDEVGDPTSFDNTQPRVNLVVKILCCLYALLKRSDHRSRTSFKLLQVKLLPIVRLRTNEELEACLLPWLRLVHTLCVGEMLNSFERPAILEYLETVK